MSCQHIKRSAHPSLPCPSSKYGSYPRLNGINNIVPACLAVLARVVDENRQLRVLVQDLLDATVVDAWRALVAL